MGDMLCLDTDKVGWHDRDIPYEILLWDSPLLVKDGQHVIQVKIQTGEGKLLWRDRTKLVLLELDDEGKQNF